MKLILQTSLMTALMVAAGCANTTPASRNDAPNMVSTAPVAVSGAAPGAVPLAVPGAVIVKVQGFSKQEGQIFVGLFDEAGYKGGEPLQGKNVDVDGQIVTLTFEGLAPGEYGIKMYQDVDRNGDMNTNAFGIPTEPYAFSNNAKGRMGPADWNAAKFMVTQAGAVQQINLK